MSVVVSCRCGQQFKTHERHAGKCVPCPACGSRMTIPAPSATTAAPPIKQGVRVQCPCGWAFLAPPSCEGKTVRCPGCNGAIMVPDADPLGIGQLTAPIESLPISSVYSAGYGYDSTERLAKRLAWIAGGSVALMAFAMVIAYLIYRFPNAPQQAQPAEVAAAKRPVERPSQPARENPFTLAPSSASPTPMPAAPTPPTVFGPPASPATSAFAPASGSTADSSTAVNDALVTPPVATQTANSSSAPGKIANASPTTGEVGVTRLPGAVQAWFEQPGDALKGLRRVGTSETPGMHFSWMTGLLPYLDQQRVYDQIDFNQPVTSKGNLQAGATEIPAFLNPLDDQRRWQGYPYEGLALTHFAGMSGVEDARNVVAAKLPRSDPRAGVFGYDEVARPAQITDGLSQTIMMVGAGVLANPWLFGGGGTIRGAREPLFDKTSGLGMKGLSGGGTIVVMADGSVRHVTENVDPRVFKAMCTIHGADSVDLDRAAPSFALEQLRPAGQSGPHSSYSNQRATGR
jgi:Protein of unknown function (DUF1559)